MRVLKIKNISFLRRAKYNYTDLEFLKPHFKNQRLVPHILRAVKIKIVEIFLIINKTKSPAFHTNYVDHLNDHAAYTACKRAKSLPL